MSITQSQIHILILDDQKIWQITAEELCAEILLSVFPDKKIKDLAKFFIASNIDEAKEILNQVEIHILLLDKDLGVDKDDNKINSIDSIPEIKSLQPFCQVIMLTADKSLRDIAQAIRSGASSYLFKSNEDGNREYRHEVITKALQAHAEQMAKTKSAAPIRKGLYSNYVCKSPAMQRFDNKLIAVSESSRPALMLGATGLGKGAAARRISELRKAFMGQSAREFAQINIGATEKNLAESILFGTEPGSFTGASKHTKAGLLDIARDGDIFIDEVGDASPDLQLKLLKVVEEKEYYRVGGSRPIKTNARFLFATNKDIQSLIVEKQFREDFYMRISVFEETLPPLRERKEDIPEIIRGFLEAACTESKHKVIRLEDFPPDLMSYFLRDEIPGNIRGIENDIERLVAHTKCDESGRPQLESWRTSLSLQSIVSIRKSHSLGLEQLLTAKTNFLTKDFPGLWETTQILERRILEEVDAKGLSIEQAAKLLKVSVNTVWSRKKQFQAQSQGKTI